MKRLIVIFFASIILASCSKDDTTCYKCTQSLTTPNYKEVGCFTKDVWDRHNYADDFGTELDKTTHCRKK